MKDYIIDCFDENIQKEIRVLNEKLQKLSPENFKYISSSVLNLNKKIEENNFTYSGLSMINSVDAYKLNTMLTNARANVMEFTTRSLLSIPTTTGTVSLDEYMRDDVLDGKLVQLSIDVPDGYSGFNSFVLINPPAEMEHTIRKDKNHRLWYYKNETKIDFLIQNRWLKEIHVLFWR